MVEFWWYNVSATCVAHNVDSLIFHGKESFGDSKDYLFHSFFWLLLWQSLWSLMPHILNCVSIDPLFCCSPWSPTSSHLRSSFWKVLSSDAGMYVSSSASSLHISSSSRNLPSKFFPLCPPHPQISPHFPFIWDLTVCSFIERLMVVGGVGRRDCLARK